VALSVFLSALVSQILEAEPHHLFGSPEARSGKTLVIQCAGIIATGRLPPAMSHTGREEEDEKRLVGAYMQGGPIILIDNVKKGSKISGDFLCASITGSSTSCRKLGFTGQTTVPTNSMICSSGNNIGVEGDMAERTIACTIDAQMEQPGTRKFEVDLHAYCLEHRGEIVAACLTILRAFVVAPDRKLTLDGMIAMGGFKPWSEMVRAALIWLGEADPIASMDSLRADDPESASLADLMVSWRDCPALGLSHWFDCGQVMAEAANETTGSLLKSALDRIFAPPKKPSEIGLGMYLGKFGRRIICLGEQNLRFEHQTEGGTRRSQYRLATVLEQGSLDLGRKD
jgi:putative DNA primase/helicase